MHPDAGGVRGHNGARSRTDERITQRHAYRATDPTQPASRPAACARFSAAAVALAEPAHRRRPAERADRARTLAHGA
jgi:hypothetical protein